jgi:multidrug efflux pump subunit AcrA (membrane-fusion protein)
MRNSNISKSKALKAQLRKAEAELAQLRRADAEYEQIMDDDIARAERRLDALVEKKRRLIEQEKIWHAQNLNEEINYARRKLDQARQVKEDWYKHEGPVGKEYIRSTGDDVARVRSKLRALKEKQEQFIDQGDTWRAESLRDAIEDAQSKLDYILRTKDLLRKQGEATMEKSAAINEQRLVELVEDEKYSLLAIPGFYEEVIEYLNNDAMDLADAIGVEFEAALEQLLTSMSAEEILQIPGVVDVLLEEFHNELV